jgi:hypothetical protein
MILYPHHIERRGLAVMERLKGDQSQLFYEFDLDDVVPPDHLVRYMPSWHPTIPRWAGSRSIRCL